MEKTPRMIMAGLVCAGTIAGCAPIPEDGDTRVATRDIAPVVDYNTGPYITKEHCEIKKGEDIDINGWDKLNDGTPLIVVSGGTCKDAFIEDDFFNRLALGVKK